MKPNVTAGDYGAFQNRLSAHDLALSQQGMCIISTKYTAAIFYVLLICLF
jgi:hypothetical protein